MVLCKVHRRLAQHWNKKISWAVHNRSYYGEACGISFCKFLKANWSVKAKIDFSIRLGSQAVDSGDLFCIEYLGFRRSPGLKIDVKSTTEKSKWAVVDLREFNNRYCDAYVWAVVFLTQDRLARPIFNAVRNGNLTEIEHLIPSISELNAQIAGFSYREDLSGLKEIRRGQKVFDPDKPSKALITDKTENKALSIKSLINKED